MEATAQITLKPSSQADQLLAGELIRQYIVEMIAFTDTPDVSDEQYSTLVRMLNLYWERDDHYPFLIYCDEELAGFSLVRRYPPDPGVFDMGQFFVVDRFKGQGVGRRAFHLTLAQFPGKWLTRVLLANERALSFWTRVISDETNGNYTLSRELEKGQEMNFIRYDA